MYHADGARDDSDRLEGVNTFFCRRKLNKITINRLNVVAFCKFHFHRAIDDVKNQEK